MLSWVWRTISRSQQDSTTSWNEVVSTLEVEAQHNDRAAEELYRFSEKLIAERKVLRQKTAQLKGRLRIAEQLLVDRPPVWVPDEERTHCFGCGDAFNFLNRRHHCRECGEVFDSKCASQIKLLSAYPMQGPQRVCETCFHEGSGLDFDDLDSSALIALGFGGTEVEDVEIFDSILEPPAKPMPRTSIKILNPKASCRCSGATPNTTPAKEKKSTTGRIRSEIPPAPPLPSQLPRILAPQMNAGSVAKPLVKKTKSAFAPPTNAGKRIDFDELQRGISRLRKAQVATPNKTMENKGDALSELRLSLKRRRRSLEDSFIIPSQTSPATSLEVTVRTNPDFASEEGENVNTANMTPTFVKDKSTKMSSTGARATSVMDGLRETVVFRDFTCQNTSINSSWME